MRDRGSVWKLGDRSSQESLGIEQRLGPELTGAVPCQLAIIDVSGDDGPNGVPFAGHRFIAGELLMSKAVAPALTFGGEVGALLRGLRAFSRQRALDLGVPLVDGPTLRDDRMRHYEDVIRRAFPLISCEARTHVERIYEAYLNNTASFDFEPILVHTDLDSNILIDREGHLCGLIDLGDAAVSSPVLDLWLPVYGFEQLGIPDQRDACLAAAGIDNATLERAKAELAFLDLRFHLLGILHGLNLQDAGFVEQSIIELNDVVPFGIECL
jgi:aminoglycoside phosphotransferase (APT) family kinase protein